MNKRNYSDLSNVEVVEELRNQIHEMEGLLTEIKELFKTMR